MLIGLPDLFILPVALLIAVGLLAFWIWAIVDVVTKEPVGSQDRLIWTVIVVVTGFIGAAIYLFVRRPQRMRAGGA